VAGVLHLTDILQFIVYRLYHRPLAEHNLVGEAHQAVFHVAPHAGDQVDAVDKEYLGELLGDVALVGEALAEDGPEETLAAERLPVIHVGLCDGKAEDLPPVVDEDVELEAVEPAHGGLAHLGDAPEHPVSFDALVITDPDGGGVHERDARAAAHAAGFQEHGHGQKHALAQLHEAAVGDGAGELPLHVALHVEEVEVLKAPEAAQVKQQADCNHLALTHNGRALGGTAQQKRRGGGVKFLAELIHKAENFRNFSVVNHREEALAV